MLDLEHFRDVPKKAFGFVLSAFSNEIKLISLALGFSPEKRTKILNLMALILKKGEGRDNMMLLSIYLFYYILIPMLMK